MRTILASMILVAAIVSGKQVKSETYYVAPIGAASLATPDGTLARPFKSLGDALYGGKVKGGDSLLLMDGNHGSFAFYQLAFDSTVTIASQNERRAHVDWISLRGRTTHLTFERLTIWSAENSGPPSGNLIETQSEAADIVFQDISVFGNADAANYLQWDAAKWNLGVSNGLSISGPRNIAQRNQITAVYMGITMTGDDSIALDNIIEGFNGDGLRALGTNNVLRGNLVKNCVTTDGNHDDGIQGFDLIDGRIAGLVIDRNTILEWTAAPDHPLRCSLQGIFLGDAIYENLTVTNNIVSTTQYHGITVGGGHNARIVNNTVVNAKSITGPYPWLRIWETPAPVNVVVANNLAMSLSGPASNAGSLTFLSNSVIGTPGAVFENPFTFDYRPKASSGFIDTADAAFAPAVDILGKPRPSGKGPDRGAYEMAETQDPAKPTDPPNSALPKPDQPGSTAPVATAPGTTAPPGTTVPGATKPVAGPGPRRPMGSWIRRTVADMINRTLGRWGSFRL